MASYRLTGNGGIPLASGTMATVALSAIPYKQKGRTVYVRATDDPTTVVEVNTRGLFAYRHGAPVQLPAWVHLFCSQANIPMEETND